MSRPDDNTQGKALNAGKKYQPHLVHLFYATAVVGASIATFGLRGLVVGGCVLVGWLYVFRRRQRRWALLYLVMVSPFVCCGLGAMLTSNVDDRDFWDFVECEGKLSTISLAVREYHDQHRAFPPAVIRASDSTPMHSWRAAILPHTWFGSEPIQKYDFSEKWNGPNNSTGLWLSSRDIACPNHRTTRHETSYFAVTGPGTMWPADRNLSLRDFTSSSTTIMLIEDHSKHIQWCEPKDMTLDEALTLLSDGFAPGPHSSDKVFSGRHDVVFSNGRNVAFANGSVAAIRQGTDRETLRMLFDPTADRYDKQAAFERATNLPDRKQFWFLQAVVFMIVVIMPAWWLHGP